MLHEELIPVIGVYMVELLFGYNTNSIKNYGLQLSQEIHK